MLISTSLLLSFETISVFEYCFVVLFLNSIVIAFSVLTSFEKYCIGFRFHDPELHDFAPIDTRIQNFLNLVDILLKSRKSSNCKGLKMYGLFLLVKRNIGLSSSGTKTSPEPVRAVDIVLSTESYSF